MNTAVEELWGPDEERALLDSIDSWVERMKRVPWHMPSHSCSDNRCSLRKR